MFEFSVLNPSLLYFGALVAIPVIIHLFHRKRFKVINWAAMEFLKISQKKTRSIMRLKHLVLLLLRCLAILLIVFALSQPLIKPANLSSFKGKTATYVVLIIDNSYSMGYKDGTKFLFEEAKRRANEIINLLTQGDSVSLILGGWKARAIIKDPTFQINIVKNEIEKIKISNSGNDLTGALQIAYELVSSSKELVKEVYLISDCQLIGFAERENEIKEVIDAISKKANIYLVRVGSNISENLAITSLNFSREVIDTLLPVRITANITNFGIKDSLDTVISLYVDDKLKESKNVIVKSKKTESVSFYYKFTESGVHSGYLQISPDSLITDNRVYFSVDVKESLNVLIVDGKPIKRHFENESDFLFYALSPFDSSDVGKNKVIIPTVQEVFNFSTFGLDKYKVLILSNLPSISDADVVQIENFVRKGGGLLIFAGDLISPGVYNTKLYKDKSGILPCIIKDKIQIKKENERFFIDKIDRTHQLFFEFTDLQVNELKKIKFSSFWDLKVDMGDPMVSVIACFNTTAPAIVSKKYGRGNVILIGVGANRRWSDLPIKPMFLPLLYKIVYFLASGSEEKRNIKVGDTITKLLSFKEYSLLPKIVTPEKLSMSLDISVNAEGKSVSFSNTDVPGIYKMVFEGSVGETTSDYFAVNVDTSESDVTKVSNDFIYKIAPKKNFTFLNDNSDIKQTITQKRKGIGIWKGILITTLCILTLESILAYKCSKREY